MPFFVRNVNCAACGGIGEVVAPLDINLSGLCCLVVKPAYDVSTKQAYHDWDNAETNMGNFYNDFAGLIFSQNQNIAEMHNILAKSGAEAAGLSGSGSALFGIYGDAKTAQKTKDKINLRNDAEFCDIFYFLS